MGNDNMNKGHYGLGFVKGGQGWCAGVVVVGMIVVAGCVGCVCQGGSDKKNGQGHDSDSTAVCGGGLVPEDGRKDGDGLMMTGDAVIDSLICNMVCVEGGSFMMGATADQGDDAFDNEKPAHRVTVDDFMIGRYEVTQREWKAVMGNNPSSFWGDNRPVESVNWDDCLLFIGKLNDRTGLHFRLPTEAEWEFAARGGSWFDSADYCRVSGRGNGAHDLRMYDMGLRLAL